MNALLDRSGMETDRLKRRLDLESGVHLGPALHAMELRNEGRPGVFTVTAMQKGRGASYVALMLARELARKHRCESLVVTLEQLMHLPYPPQLGDTGLLAERLPHVWRPDEKALHKYECPVDRLRSRVAELRAWGGGYVLLDCPPLQDSAAALTAAGYTDGILLTAAAGESGARELGPAERLFRGCPAPLLGIVLNKRTYAIPRAIFRWL